MLVLTRKCDEDILVGDEQKIVIRVLSIRNNQVRLGVDASKDVPIYRREVYERIFKKKRGS